MFLGRTAAHSKKLFIEWVDNMVCNIASERCKVYTLSRQRDHGNFANISNEDYQKIIASFSKLKRWIGNIMSNDYSCGAFIAITGGWCGRVTEQGIFIGLFQT